MPASVDVVIVDQFEELFTLTDDEAIQREFVRLLVARVNDGTGRVVISLRADFYGHCTTIPELAPLLARRQVVVGPLSEQELRVVITRPAEHAGLVVADELVDAHRHRSRQPCRGAPAGLARVGRDVASPDRRSA